MWSNNIRNTRTFDKKDLKFTSEFLYKSLYIKYEELVIKDKGIDLEKESGNITYIEKHILGDKLLKVN